MSKLKNKLKAFNTVSTLGYPYTVRGSDYSLECEVLDLRDENTGLYIENSRLRELIDHLLTQEKRYRKIIVDMQKRETERILGIKS